MLSPPWSSGALHGAFAVFIDEDPAQFDDPTRISCTRTIPDDLPGRLTAPCTSAVRWRVGGLEEGAEHKIRVASHEPRVGSGFNKVLDVGGFLYAFYLLS